MAGLLAAAADMPAPRHAASCTLHIWRSSVVSYASITGWTSRRHDRPSWGQQHRRFYLHNQYDGALSKNGSAGYVVLAQCCAAIAPPPPPPNPHIRTRVWTTRASTHKRTRNTHARACAAHAKGVHSMVQRKCPVASHRTRGVHRGELPHLEGEGNCPHTSKFKKIKRYE